MVEVIISVPFFVTNRSFDQQALSANAQKTNPAFLANNANKANYKKQKSIASFQSRSSKRSGPSGPQLPPAVYGTTQIQALGKKSMTSENMTIGGHLRSEAIA